MVQTCTIAGGATSLPCIDCAATSASVYTGLASPMASVQVRIAGRLTGSLASRGEPGPAARTLSAAAKISSVGGTPSVWGTPSDNPPKTADDPPALGRGRPSFGSVIS